MNEVSRFRSILLSELGTTVRTYSFSYRFVDYPLVGEILRIATGTLNSNDRYGIGIWEKVWNLGKYLNNHVLTIDAPSNTINPIVRFRGFEPIATNASRQTYIGNGNAHVGTIDSNNVLTNTNSFI